MKSPGLEIVLQLLVINSLMMNTKVTDMELHKNGLMLSNIHMG